MQKNNIDELAVLYIEDINFRKNRTLTRKYANSLSQLNKTDKAISTLEKFIESSSILDREVSFELLMFYLKEEKLDYVWNFWDNWCSSLLC